MQILNKDIFIKNGINNVENIDCSNFNVVIGENGAGKTRFLHSVKECYSSNNDYNVIYAYFPDIGVSYNKSLDNAVYDTPLYDVVFEKSKISFDDFLKYIEIHGYDFLEDILNILKVHARYKNSNRYNNTKGIEEFISSVTFNLLRRKLEISDKGIELSNNNNDVDTLKMIMLKDALPLMSPGELILFYLAIFVTTIKYSNEKKTVLILDEPECHLHPRALLDFVNLIRNECIFESCWIATHSIFLLPAIKYSEVIYLSNSNVKKRNSKYYDDIYNEIVGDNDSVSQFLFSKYMWQYYEFIAECFCVPEEVKNVNMKDEQLLKFSDFINQKYMDEQDIDVLDYGGGKGRLGEYIERKLKEHDSNKKVINYSVFDPFRKKEKRGPFKYLEDIPGDSEEMFDCVVLMNVLHEIDVLEWVPVFTTIGKVLKSNGFLLIFEVISLSKGENPYGDSGFILLQKSQMQILFSDNNLKSFDFAGDNKSNLFVINKNQINNVSFSNVKAAISSLKDDTSKILEMHYLAQKKMKDKSRDDIEYSLPRKHAFVAQQYINAKFALEQLSKWTPKWDRKRKSGLNKYSYEIAKFTFEQINSRIEPERSKLLHERAQIDDFNGRKCRRVLNKEKNGGLS